jgi:hypothetical protein
MKKPNKIVKMVFEECETDDKDVVALKVYIEAPDRDLDEEWSQCEDPSLSEIWATESMSFIEQYMHRQMMEQDVNGFVMTTPKKGDMN